MLPVPERHQAALGPGFVPAGSVPPSVGRAGPGAPQLHHPTAGGPPCSVAPLAPLTHTTGEISDFAYILTLLDELTTSDACADDGHTLQPAQLYAYLSRVMYNRRNKFDPLWNSLVVGGVASDGAPFLGTVSMIGSHYTDDHVATGFGAQLARPLFREKHRCDMSASEARALLEEALRVCYYRDKNSINKFVVATVTRHGAAVSEPFALATEWSLKAYDNPAAVVTGTW